MHRKVSESFVEVGLVLCKPVKCLDDSELELVNKCNKTKALV